MLITQVLQPSCRFAQPHALLELMPLQLALMQKVIVLHALPSSIVRHQA